MFLLFPISLKFDDIPLFEKKPFKMRIGIRTPNDGLTFDPQEIFLNIGPEKIRTKSIKPVCDNELSLRTISEMSAKGVYNICLCQDENNFIKSNPNNIPANDIWYCYDLIFDTQVPYPDEELSLSVSGVKMNGRPYEIAEIYFEKEEWSHYDSAP